MKKLLYPACFYPCEEQEGYTVVVPDLPGCVTQSSSLLDAIGMAVDAASGWILDEMEDGNPIPPASKIEDVCADDRPSGFVNLIVLDIDAYAEKYGEKAVRKNLTIPAWLNTYAEANNVNFSRVLQDALVAMYQRQTNTSDQYTNERVLL